MAICPDCGIEFTCGAQGEQPCWCQSLPALPMPTAEAACWCPACLRKRVLAQAASPDAVPRFSPRQ